MKIKPEHYAELKSKIGAFVDGRREEVLAYHEGLKSDERVRDLDMRFRWDLTHACIPSAWICDVLYPYMNDDHIDTALRRVIVELNLPRKGMTVAPAPPARTVATVEDALAVLADANADAASIDAALALLA